MLKDQATGKPLPLGKPKKAFDVLGFVSRYGLFIVLLGGFLFAMLTPLIFVVKKPYYEVHALMRVDPIVPTLFSSTEQSSIVSYYARYMNTTATAMTTIDILEKSLTAMEPEKREALFPKGLPMKTCAAILQGIVAVTPDGRSHVLDLKISGSKPDGLAEFLNALMQTYMEETRKNDNNSSTERLRFLYAQKNVITREMSTIQNDLDSLTRDIGTSSFSEPFNFAAKSRDNLLFTYNNAMNERLSAEAEYEAILRTNTELKKISVEPLVNEIVLNSTALASTDSWTYQQLQQMRSTTDGLTEVNPERISVEGRMQSMKEYATDLRNDVRKNARQVIIGKRDIEMEKSLITAKNTYETNKSREDTLRLAMDRTGKEAQRISIGIHKGEYLTASWQNKFDLLNNIEKRITEIEIEKKAPLRISVLSEARTPGQPLKSNINKITLMLLFGSFGLVGAAFAAFEVFDETIRKSGDIKQALGHPPIQTIVNIRTPNAGDEMRYSIAPDDFRAHQIGNLAIKLYHEKEVANSRIILFTGTDKGVGSSSITVSCAKALSQLAEKILIIDADLEAAPVAESAEFQIILPGLCDYLSGSHSLEESIITTEGENIDMMYAGNLTGKAIPRQKIRELFEQLKQTYDFICVDGAPLLESHMTEHLAIHADIVALIALGDSSKFSDLKKSAELLVMLGVPTIAPILNFGGNRKTLSVVEMFDNPPALLKKLLSEKVRQSIKKQAFGLQLIDRILKKAEQFEQQKK
ncbi:AAA family ATPase [Chlorobium sp. N1]|uniref:GumC family protein n=1 Tax=Chlorobium sp. N1 TaxID=2491138 RepID=UPI00103FAAF3|nr:AAA family ATPase [Chlorobium sp. N1]TCD48547.1 hypothetical protein E0L29_01315 [Chlorobium sp. N1]